MPISPLPCHKRRPSPRFSLWQVVADLSRRPVLKSAVVALKTLVTSHKLMQQGAPQARPPKRATVHSALPPLQVPRQS